MLKFFEIIKRNIENIGKSSLTIVGSLFSILSIVLSFVTWEEAGITKAYVKVIIFCSILMISLLVGVFWIYILKRSNEIGLKGDGKINVCYADIMKIAFPKKNKGKKIIVIPVNTCFDTIVDQDLALCDKPLVASTTVHGLWVENMLKHGFSIEDIDSAIDNYIHIKNIIPIKELTQQEKNRGKLKCFENGTVIIVEGENDVEFFLLAVSEFDKNNKAQSSKEDIIISIKKLLEFYDINGQGYQMFLPLIGTGRSRSGLSHEDSLQIIKSILLLYSDKLHGEINVVIYSKDRDKVSIFD